MNQIDSTVFNFCVACGQQVRPADWTCSCCGGETLEVNRVTLPRHGRDRRPGRRDDAAQQEDPFYLL